MRALLALTAMSLVGCAEFPCADEVRQRALDEIAFSYDRQEARYTYWLADGAQRVVFARDDVPEPARHAVLVHLPGKTSGNVHGAIGWSADISSEQPVARRTPMAHTRARAYAAWSGVWAAQWVETSADVTIERQGLRHDATVRDAPPDEVGRLEKELRDQGIALERLDLQRAVRNVAARQPTPRDFGLSVAIEPAWLFVDPSCGACQEATKWLDRAGVGHHLMLVSDPTNAATLRALSEGGEAVVPTLWAGSTLVAGFDPQGYARALEREENL